MSKDHEHQRRQFWCDIYVAYVGASNSSAPDAAKTWADYALKRFDERFKDQTAAWPKSEKDALDFLTSVTASK